MEGAALLITERLYNSDKGEGGCHCANYFAGVMYDAGESCFVFNGELNKLYQKMLKMRTRSVREPWTKNHHFFPDFENLGAPQQVETLLCFSCIQFLCVVRKTGKCLFLSPDT